MGKISNNKNFNHFKTYKNAISWNVYWEGQKWDLDPLGILSLISGDFIIVNQWLQQKVLCKKLIHFLY